MFSTIITAARSRTAVALAGVSITTFTLYSYSYWKNEATTLHRKLIDEEEQTAELKRDVKKLKMEMNDLKMEVHNDKEYIIT